ncbi:TPA: hypothetical protein DIU22_05415 [Candidatus Woesebacteria bacterium]|nr:hypothetical protein [Candidatus Woesebacteria bacterium]
MHVDIVKKGEDAKTESLLKISDFKGFISNLPPAVRKRANFFEVLWGNHRVFATIKRNDKNLMVLLVCDNDPQSIT